MFRIFWIKSSLFSVDFQKSINLNFEKILNLRIFDNKKKINNRNIKCFCWRKIFIKNHYFNLRSFFFNIRCFDDRYIRHENFFFVEIFVFFAIFFYFLTFFFCFSERRILKIDSFFFSIFLFKMRFLLFWSFFHFFANVLRSDDKQNDNIHTDMIHDDNFKIVFFIREQFFYSFVFYINRVDVFFCKCSRFKIKLRNDQKRDLKNRTKLYKNRRLWKNHFIEFFRNYYTIALTAFNLHAYMKRFIAKRF